ncbi:hypothetical protein ACE4RR_06210 [Alteribacillus sp. HJP-4]
MILVLQKVQLTALILAVCVAASILLSYAYPDVPKQLTAVLLIITIPVYAAYLALKHKNK